MGVSESTGRMLLKITSLFLRTFSHESGYISVLKLYIFFSYFKSIFYVCARKDFIKKMFFFWMKDISRKALVFLLSVFPYHGLEFFFFFNPIKKILFTSHAREDFLKFIYAYIFKYTHLKFINRFYLITKKWSFFLKIMYFNSANLPAVILNRLFFKFLYTGGKKQKKILNMYWE